MGEREFRTEQRITNIMKNNDNFSTDDIKKIYYAFEHLVILRKSTEMLMSTHERTFALGKEQYAEEMKWINEFMRSKGMDEDIFTDLNDYRTSSDDYDYYYEYKTPTQYKKDEEERKAKKLEKAQEGKEPFNG